MPARMRGYGAVQKRKARLSAMAVKWVGPAASQERVGAMWTPQEVGGDAGQKSGLIVASRQQAGPVQGHRDKDRVMRDQRCRSAREPATERHGKIGPVSMFEREYELAPGAGINKHRARLCPGSCNLEAIVAMSGSIALIAGKRCSAKIADSAGDEARVAPAGPAEPEVVIGEVPAGDAAGRVDGANEALHRVAVPLDGAA